MIGDNMDSVRREDSRTFRTKNNAIPERQNKLIRLKQTVRTKIL
jgi:hypothetical protein